VLGAGIVNSIVSLTVVFVPQITRVAESVTTGVRNMDFVEAARASGAALHHHARAHARQRAGTDFRLCHRSDLGIDDPCRGPVVSRPGDKAAGAGMGLMLNTLRTAIYVNPWVRIARRDDLRGIDLLQPAQRRNAQRHGHPELAHGEIGSNWFGVRGSPLP